MNNLDDRAQGMRRRGFLDALLAALARREAVCQLIAEASDETEARLNLSRLLEITEEQAGVVLEIRLGQFTAAQRSAIESERRELSTALGQSDPAEN
jgi:DNA gyrase/topoisomerase IV subunit A